MKIGYSLMRHHNPRISVKMANTKLKFKGSRLRIKYDEGVNLFSINDDGKVHFFGNLIRGYSLYGKGLSRRANILFNSYLLSLISRQKTVVDCGANFGDVWLSLDEKIEPSRYITFEPGELEHNSIKMNAPKGIHSKLGLSNKSEVVRFYVNEQDADSSIVEPVSYSHFVDIKTTTLSNYLKTQEIDKIKLFKLEAEGFEPEILEGASETLQNIHYIALDGGYERGKNQDETFSQISNFLTERNFEMVSINFNWRRALFKNKTIS